MSDLELLAKGIADNILAEAKGLLHETWDKMPDEDKNIIQRASLRVGQLSLDKLQGKNVDADLRVVNATLGNMTYVQASRASKLFWNAVERVATSIFTSLMGIATKGLIGA